MACSFHPDSVIRCKDYLKQLQGHHQNEYQKKQHNYQIICLMNGL